MSYTSGRGVGTSGKRSGLLTVGRVSKPSRTVVRYWYYKLHVLDRHRSGRCQRATPYHMDLGS